MVTSEYAFAGVSRGRRWKRWSVRRKGLRTAERPKGRTSERAVPRSAALSEARFSSRSAPSGSSSSLRTGAYLDVDPRSRQARRRLRVFLSLRPWLRSVSETRVASEPPGDQISFRAAEPPTKRAKFLKRYQIENVDGPHPAIGCRGEIRISCNARRRHAASVSSLVSRRGRPCLPCGIARSDRVARSPSWR